MKHITLQRIHQQLTNQELTPTEAKRKARINYTRAALKHLKQKGITEDIFTTIKVAVPNPLTTGGNVKVTVTHNDNPYSDPGLFLNSKTTTTHHSIKKSTLLT